MNEIASQCLPLGFLQNMGLPELIVIGGIMLLLFGQRLPNVARSLGKSVSEFKSGLKEGSEANANTGAETPQK